MSKQGEATASSISSVLPTNIQHNDILCDVCNNGVFGIRYKCKQCPDLDLCSACKAKSVHSEHEFTEISKPVPYFSWLTEILQARQNQQ